MSANCVQCRAPICGIDQNLPHVTIARSLDVLMEEDVHQLLRSFASLVDVLGVSFGVALQLFVLSGGARAARHRRGQMARLLLARGRRASGTGSLRGRARTTEESSASGVQVLVGELLDQTIGPVVGVVAHPGLIGGLRGLQVGLAIVLLSVLGLRRIGVAHEITLTIGSILSIDIFRRTLVLVDRLRERGGGGGIRAVVGGGIEATIVVPEIQVEAVVVGVHLLRLLPSTKRRLDGG